MYFFRVGKLLSCSCLDKTSDGTHLFCSILTVLHPCNDRIRVQRFTNSKLVDGRDSELVFIAFDKVVGIERASLTLGCDHSPGDPGCLPLLYHIMSDGSTSVILWWIPPYCALFSRNASETDGTLHRPRCVFKGRGNKKYKKNND